MNLASLISYLRTNNFTLQTYVKNVTINLDTRMAFGRRKEVISFVVEEDNGRTKKRFSVDRLGWIGAWKTALLYASRKGGSKSRREVVRFLHKPPKVVF